THLDGPVLARPAFPHSVNYRSVVVFVRADTVTDPQRKYPLLEAFTERLYPGRWGAARPPNEQEFGPSLVAELPLREVRAEVRTRGARWSGQGSACRRKGWGPRSRRGTGRGTTRRRSGGRRGVRPFERPAGSHGPLRTKQGRSPGRVRGLGQRHAGEARRTGG